MPPQENNVPTAPTENPPEDTRRGKRKHIWLFLITAIVILVIGYVVYSLIFNCCVLPDKSYLQKTTENQQVADWKTYQNEEYGFEFNYPEGWEFGILGKNEQGMKIDLIHLNSPERKKLLSSTENVDAPAEFTMSIHKKITSENIASFANSFDKGWFTTYESKISSVVDNKDCIIFDDSTSRVGHAPVRAAFVDAGKYVLFFSINDYAYKQEKLDVFNQILSTFKFISTSTEVVDISTWKTYRNEEYGFEIKIPLDWQIESNEDYIRFISLKNIEARKQNYENCSKTPPQNCAYDMPFSNLVFVPNFDNKRDDLTNLKTVLINGLNFTYFSVKYSITSDAGYFIEKNGKNYGFEIPFEDEKDLLNQILSTFKFTK